MFTEAAIITSYLFLCSVSGFNMVAIDVISYLSAWNLDAKHQLSDAADTFSSWWTILVTLVTVTIVTVRIYILTPITCHTPIAFMGANFNSFVDNFCWVEGSIAVTQNVMHESFPTNERQWQLLARTSTISM